MKDLREQIEDLNYDISANIDHGECFYEEDMLKDFIAILDKMKELAIKYYQENQSEMEDE